MANQSCGLSYLAVDTAEKLEAIVYRIQYPICIIVGMSGNIVLLFTFYKQSKTESAYGYQVVLTISKTLEVFAVGTFIVALKWLAHPEVGVAWYVTNYGLMCFTAAGLSLHTIFITSSLLLSISMSADRVFSLL